MDLLRQHQDNEWAEYLAYRSYRRKRQDRRLALWWKLLDNAKQISFIALMIGWAAIMILVFVGSPSVDFNIAPDIE